MEKRIVSKGKDYSVIYDDQFEEVVSKFKWYLGNGGYVRTKIFDGEKIKSISMHRLILGCIDSKKDCHHINKNVLDNRLENLTLLDRKKHWEFHPRSGGKENKGSFKKGNINKKSKLTMEIVLKARQMYFEEKVSMRNLAKMFGVSHTPMNYAIKGITWKGEENGKE